MGIEKGIEKRGERTGGEGEGGGGVITISRVVRCKRTGLWVFPRGKMAARSEPSRTGMADGWLNW